MRHSGHKLGRYELLRLIGEGGMGKVYEAVMHGPGGFRKPVALKVLKGAGSLAREARLGGLLRHPNLVEVYELGEIEGTWFCAMELVRGGPLKQHVPLSPRAAVEAAMQACAGLAHAHSQIGLVHLDLKPSNLLLEGARVKVADLGIARAHGFHQKATIQGTPAYMAPEHLAGMAVDGRADVYSMGVLLNALILGFPSDAPDEVPQLASVLERALDRDPNGRYRSVAELAAALGTLSLDGPGLSEVVGASQPGPRLSWTDSSGTLSEATFALVEEATGARSNLGPPAAPLIGREHELELLAELLERPGLVTLKGPGGMGKTRLAQAAARTLHQDLSRDTWFVDLSEAQDSLGVFTALSSALKAPLGRGSLADQAQQLGNALAAWGPLLLVLDNFEQVVDSAPWVAQWLADAPELRVLVTSRQPLGLHAERVMELQPLSVTQAVALLQRRASSRGRPIEDSPALRELARHLDGIPLALELAAARLGLLTPERILEMMDRRLTLLKNPLRGVAARQATLRSTFDWSWQLLSPHEQQAFAQLSVFAGGFTAPAAEAVLRLGKDAPFTLEVLESLVDHSLVRTLDHHTGRLGLFESARAFASEQLGNDLSAQRHSLWYATRGTPEAIAAIRVHGGIEVLTQLRAELDNLIAAFEEALRLDLLSAATQLALAIWEVRKLQGPLNAAGEMAARLLESPVLDPTDRARLQLMWGHGQRLSGESANGPQLLRSAYARFRQEDLLSEAGFCMMYLGIGAIDKVGSETSLNCYERAAELFEAAGDDSALGMLHAYWGAHHRHARQPDQAHACYDKALSLLISSGNDRYVGHAHANRGILLRQTGRWKEARLSYRLALEAHRRIGDRSVEGHLLQNMGILEQTWGNLEAAARHLERAVAINRSTGKMRDLAISLGNLGSLHHELGDLVGGRDELMEAVHMHRRTGNKRFEAIVLGDLGRLLADTGDLARATEHLQQGADISEAIGDHPTAGSWHCELALLAARQGEHALATAHVTSADALLDYANDEERAIMECVRGQVALAAGRRDEALSWLASARTRMEGIAAPTADGRRAMETLISALDEP